MKPKLVTVDPDRFQVQRWYVKLGRWLRWKPPYLFVALWWMMRALWWSLTRYDPKRGWPRFGQVGIAWQACMTTADFRMRRYLTIEEARRRLDC